MVNYSDREAPASWHPDVQDYWMTVKQSDFTSQWEQTDWWTAWFAAGLLNDYLMNPRKSSSMLKEITQILRDLGLTLSSRNYAKIEVVKPEPIDASHQQIMNEYRDYLAIDPKKLPALASGDDDAEIIDAVVEEKPKRKRAPRKKAAK